MRISLLQEREPFAEILQQTLAEYWEDLYGSEFQVEWVRRGQMPSKLLGQEWLANIYLNAIFCPNVDSQALDPIQREFGRSVVAWKAPVQRQYVRLATSRVAARMFSQARMFVSPAIEDSKSQLIIPGNQKIRILNHRAATSTCLLKSGFSDEAFKNEIRARRLACQHGIPVPRLDSVSDRWFSEEYVSATPLNRLASPERRTRFLKDAVSALKTLVSQTQQLTAVSTYAEGLVSEVQSYVDRNNRYKPPLCDEILTRVRDLQQLLTDSVSGDEEIVTAETHGDFQPANILIRDDDYWLIDWENSRRRQSSYDLFVYEFQSRIANDLANRMTLALNHGEIELPGDSTWPGLDRGNKKQLCVQFSLFLIEELNWHLRENDNQYFDEPSHGLQRTLREAKSWLNSMTHRTISSQAC